MNVLIGNDYNLEQFYMFEPYFFVTSDKWIACHPRLSEDMCGVILSDGSVIEKSSFDINNRNLVKKTFNKAVKEITGKVVAFVIDIECDEKELSYENYYYVWNNIKETLYEFAKENKTIICWSTHFYQYNSDGEIRYPHIHVMYPKKPRKKNEPQNWIIEHCKEVNNDIG